MGSLQTYFEFKMYFMCGIPAVTMMGTVADWKLLREKIEHLLEFEVQNNPDGNVMELWVGYLRKVCDGFVESAEHPDSPKTLEFWDKVGHRPSRLESERMDKEDSLPGMHRDTLSRGNH